jgi:hypothetical protein
MKRVAASDPANATERPANRTVFFDSRDEIGAAGWLETAALTQERTERVLVPAYNRDQGVAGQSPDDFR